MAISPIPLVAVIVMLFTPRAKQNGPAFLVGWVVGLSVLAAVVYLVADALNVASDSSASDSNRQIECNNRAVVTVNDTVYEAAVVSAARFGDLEVSM